MAATDDYAGFSPTLDGPYARAAAVSPSDTVDLTDLTSALYVGVAGDVVLITAGGDTVTFKAAPVGVLRVRVSRVKSTGTTATNILALW